MMHKSNSGWYVVIILSIIPVGLWLSVMPLELRFVNSSASLISLGQIFGLAGMAMFALSFVLSCRLKMLEDYFGGMNKLYIAHHICGGVAFILLLLHPLLLATSYIPISLKAAAELLVPSNNWQVNLGIAALILMMSLLIFTFFVNLPYQVWRLTHKFLGVAFFFGALHAFFIPSDISRNVFLRNYMLTLIGIGLVCYMFRSVLGRIFVYRYTYFIKAVNLLNPYVVEIVMTPKKRQMKFQPGQFVYIGFNQKGLHEVHPFSISSAPHDVEMTLTLKSAGDFTSSLGLLKIGTAAKIEGPYGKFVYYLYKNPRQVWIAGGIGITPFISMARSLNDPHYHVDFYVLARDTDDAVYLKEAVLAEARFPNLRIIPYFSAIKGRLTAVDIEKQSGDLSDKEIFICGPPPMMYNLKQQLIILGVKASHIHTEEFTML